MVIALGIDLVDVERVARMLERDAERCAAKLLTEGEWAYCSEMKRPAPHVAVRLAAKEAAFKALAGSDDARAIGWREIEVVHGEHRRPELRLHGRATDRLAVERPAGAAGRGGWFGVGLGLARGVGGLDQ